MSHMKQSRPDPSLGLQLKLSCCSLFAGDWDLDIGDDGLALCNGRVYRERGM